MATTPQSIPPIKEWDAENQLLAFTKCRAMDEYWIAAHEIPTKVQFTTSIMIFGEEGHAHFLSFILDEEVLRMWDSPEIHNDAWNKKL